MCGLLLLPIKPTLTTRELPSVLGTSGHCLGLFPWLVLSWCGRTMAQPAYLPATIIFLFCLVTLPG